MRERRDKRSTKLQQKTISNIRWKEIVVKMTRDIEVVRIRKEDKIGKAHLKKANYTISENSEGNHSKCHRGK